MLRNCRDILFPVVIVLLAMFLTPAAADSLQELKFDPGNEVLVKAEYKGIAQSRFMLYLPSDFNSSVNWPSIFFYRGQGEVLSTGLFQQLTQGKGFVIVAMEYVPVKNKEMTLGQYLNYLKAELKNTAVVRIPPCCESGCSAIIKPVFMKYFKRFP